MGGLIIAAKMILSSRVKKYGKEDTDMREWNEDYDENPDEFQEENPNEVLEEYMKELPDEHRIEDEDIPEVGWKEEIKNIEDTEIRNEEIEIAKEILDEEKKNNERYESGEITEYQHWEKYEFGIRKEKVNASFRCSLESIGLTFDHLGDLDEDVEITIAEGAGNEKPARMKEGVKKLIRHEGPDFAQDLADQEKDKGNLQDKSYKSISRQVRLYGK